MSDKPEILARYNQTFSQAVVAGLSNGDLEQEDKDVTAKIDKLTATGGIEKVEFQRSYTRLVAKTPQGALILADGNPETLLAMVTDNYDATVRSNVRASIVAAATGPEAAIKKAAAALAKQFNLPIEAVMPMIQGLDVVKAGLGGAVEQPATV
jgi:hypothetical protein